MTKQIETNEETEQPEQKRLPGLLASVFDRMRRETRDSSKVQEKIIEEFTARLNDAFEQVHKESQERERLLEEQLRAMEQQQRFRIQRIRLLTIPVTIVAVASLGYLFYTVHIMGRSMSSMTLDIHHMRGSMQEISGDTRAMSENTTAMNQQMNHMNGNLTHLNRNVDTMGQDVGNMSHSVSPFMNGLRSFMPF